MTFKMIPPIVMLNEVNLLNADIHSKMLCAENSADVLSGQNQCMAENSLLFSNNQNDSEFLYNKTPSFMLNQPNSNAKLKWVNEADLATNMMRILDVENNYPYILLFFSFVAIFYFTVFLKERFSRNAEMVLKERKALIGSAMSTALHWKTAAKKLREDKVKKIHEEIEKNKEHDNVDNDPDNELNKNDEQIEFELKQQIPQPSKIYEMLYDEKEENKALYFGIEQSKYNQVENLLRLSLQITLNNYVESTYQARKPKIYPLKKWQSFAEVLPFQDGVRLKELVQLIVKKVKKNIGSHVIPCDELKEAEDCLKKIGIERMNGFKILLRMAFPALPYVLLAVALNSLKIWGDVMVFASRSAMLNDIKFGSEEGLNVIKQTTLSFIVLRCFFECVGMLTQFLRSRSSKIFSLPLRSAVMQGLFRQDVEYFDRQKLQPLISAATSESGRLAWVFFSLPIEIISCVTGIVTSVSMIYSVAPDMLLVTLLPCIAMGTTHYLICKFMEKKWSRRHNLRKLAEEKTSELLHKVRTVREFSMEISEAEKRSALDAYSVEMENNISGFETCIWHGFGLFWAIQHGMVTHFGAGQVTEGVIQLGTLMAISDQMGRITWSLRHLLERSPLIFKAMEPAERICDILTAFGSIEGDPFQNKELLGGNTCNEETRNKLKANGFRRPKRIQGKIEFKNVKFSYPSDPRKKILHGLSFASNPNANDPKKRIRTVAFVGETGCGKSTAINLLKKFYTQSSGEILLDGHPLSEYDPRYLRQQMAIVAQTTELLHKTLRENITYGMQTMPSDSEIIDACKKAAIWDDILEMPDKLDTVYEDNLSGGQKQRISIARALIRKPTILLLDEATSALDAVNERVVQNAINKMMDERGEGCSITVAHRLTTIRKSDVIIVMHKGKKVEAGTHDELMKLEVVKSKSGAVVSGWYRNLWDTQQGDDKDVNDK